MSCGSHGAIPAPPCFGGALGRGALVKIMMSFMIFIVPV
jgi:hypothetical protein